MSKGRGREREREKRERGRKRRMAYVILYSKNNLLAP